MQISQLFMFQATHTWFIVAQVMSFGEWLSIIARSELGSDLDCSVINARSELDSDLDCYEIIQTSGTDTSSVRTCEPTLNHMPSFSVPCLCLNNHPILRLCCLLKCSSSSCSRHYLSDDIWLTSYTNVESDIQNLAIHA